MNRAVIFTKALALYKSAKHYPSNLRKSIIIEFSGEEGVGVGASDDSFGEASRKANMKLFEGQPGRRVPRYHGGQRKIWR